MTAPKTTISSDRTPDRAGRRTPVGWVIAILLAGGIFLPVKSAAATEVVIVRTSDAEPYTLAEAALRKQLADKSYTIRSLLAREASDKGIDKTIGKPDVVVAIGTAAAKWLHKQLPEGVKLVYCMVSNPAEATLLQGHPCVGVTTDVSVADQLKLVAETLPNARAVGLMYHSDTADGKATLAELQAALPAGWRVEAVAVNDYPSVAAAIDALCEKHIDIAWTTADPKLYDTAAVRALLLTAVRTRIPVWGYSTAFVRAGGLIGVGVEPSAEGTQAADLVVAAVAKPAEFKTRADPPASFQIAVNLIVAEQIGVTIPVAIKNRAAFVYQPDK